MSGSVSLNSVDRQLKKIYDCLNIGSNKKAVQEVDRLPKNIRDLTVFKTLKSLALIRMQKFLQAFEILDEIDLDADLDEVTLQTMTSCCKESVNVDKIVAMYEAAARRKPNDPDTLSHLYMAYVRVFDFKRQKEIAMQMYKNFPVKKRLHTFWAIMSLVMQSQAAKEYDCASPVDMKVCLSLAEKMCEKMIDEERTQEEIELYLMILRKQNKHEEEYKFLTGPICSRLTDHLSWYKRRQAYLCLDLKMYSRAFKHYFPTLIQDYPDQLEYYQGLFKSALLLDTEAPSQQQPVAVAEHQGSQNQSASGTPVKFSSALLECIDIVEKQINLSNHNEGSYSDPNKNLRNQKSVSRTSSLNSYKRGCLRGPYMARVELYQMLSTRKDALPNNVYDLCINTMINARPHNKFQELGLKLELLMLYFTQFGHKITCHYDFDYMLSRLDLSSQDKDKLIQTIDQTLSLSSDAYEGDEKNASKRLKFFYTRLNYDMLRHALNDYKISDNLSDRLKLAKEFIDKYDRWRKADPLQTTNKTESLPVDHYCLLAINSIMTNSIDRKMINQDLKQPILTDTVIVSLIVAAECAMLNSPSNHQIKLILLKLYSLIGASKQCSEVLVSLDIKHFQIDTIGHLLNPVLYNTGNYNLSKESLDTCLGFYAHGIRECFECLTSSYREGRFSKIEEISNVLRRLMDSLNAAQCFLLKGVLNNVTASSQEELVLACKSFCPEKGLRVYRDDYGFGIIKDSRDFKILRSLHFETNDLVQKRQQETLADEKQWLKVRYNLLRGAFKQFELLVVDRSSSSSQSKKGKTTKDKRTNQIAELKSISKQVDEVLAKLIIVSGQNDDDRYSYLEPESSPFRWRNIQFDSLIDLVKPLIFCTSPLDLTQEFLDKYSIDLDICVSNIERRLTNINSLIAMKQALSSLTITLEILSLCVTSLVSLNQAESAHISANSSNNSGSTPKGASNTATNSHPQASTKVKSALGQIINKTETQLLKISNLIKSFDLKTLPVDRVTQLETALLSDPDQLNVTLGNAGESNGQLELTPLMGLEAQGSILGKVKEKILDSYSESLKEIESTCRRKIKLLRSKS